MTDEPRTRTLSMAVATGGFRPRRVSRPAGDCTAAVTISHTGIPHP